MALFIDATSPNSIVSAVSFGEPKVNASGGKNVAVFNKNQRAIMSFSTPEVTTYGINENNYDAGKPPTYDMTLQLDKSDSSMTFIQNLLALEAYILEEAFKNSKKWFGKQMSMEVLREFWSPFLRFPKIKDTGDVDTSKSPTLRLKLSYFEGSFKYVEVYNTQNQLIFPKSNTSLQDLIPKGSEVKCLVRLNGIWFAGGKFGLTGKPSQVIVRPKTRVLPGICQMSMSSTSSRQDEDSFTTEVSETHQEHVSAPAPVTENSGVNVTDTDDEDEDPDKEYSSAKVESTESAETSEPAPPPVKGRTRVKKNA
jgi:hypothetical protein